MTLAELTDIFLSVGPILYVYVYNKLMIRIVVDFLATTDDDTLLKMCGR